MNKRFFKDCPKCNGIGEVPAHSQWASSVEGKLTGVAYPQYEGGHSGEILADANKSYCSFCKGCGIVVKH